MSRRVRENSLENKVYIGNLNEFILKPEVETIFACYGKLRSIWVARNPPGFAFVEFEDYRDAEDAVKALDGTLISGTKIRVEISHGRVRQSTLSRKKYFNNLRYHRKKDYRFRSRSTSHSRSRSRSINNSRNRSRSRSDLRLKSQSKSISNKYSKT